MWLVGGKWWREKRMEAKREIQRGTAQQLREAYSMVGICTWITICLATTLTVSVYSHHSFQSCPVLSSLREFDTPLPSAPATGRTTSRIPTTSSTTTTSIVLQPFHSIIDEEEEEFFGRKSSFPPGGRSGFSRRPNFCLSNLGFEVPTASDLRSFHRSRFSPSRGLGCAHGRVFRGSFINENALIFFLGVFH